MFEKSAMQGAIGYWRHKGMNEYFHALYLQRKGINSSQAEAAYARYITKADTLAAVYKEKFNEAY